MVRPHGWGSCTGVDRSIRISDRLKGAPAYVLDYVLFHEAIHLNILIRRSHLTCIQPEYVHGTVTAHKLFNLGMRKIDELRPPLRIGKRIVVGIACFFLTPYLYSRNYIMAVQDLLYIAPEYRRGWIGIRLIKESEKLLKSRGVGIIDLACRPHVDNTTLYERLGYKYAEKRFSKLV